MGALDASAAPQVVAGLLGWELLGLAASEFVGPSPERLDACSNRKVERERDLPTVPMGTPAGVCGGAHSQLERSTPKALILYIFQHSFSHKFSRCAVRSVSKREYEHLLKSSSNTFH